MKGGVRGANVGSELARALLDELGTLAGVSSAAGRFFAEER